LQGLYDYEQILILVLTHRQLNQRGGRSREVYLKPIHGTTVGCCWCLANTCTGAATGTSHICLSHFWGTVRRYILRNNTGKPLLRIISWWISCKVCWTVYTMIINSCLNYWLSHDIY